MTLTHRRIVYLVFIAFFFVIAPIIALYGGGWRYSFKRGEWYKTGGVVVVAYPEEALVRVDGKLEPHAAPTRITKLSPREYDIVVELDGYYDWRQFIDVAGGETVFLSDAELFRKNAIPSYIGALPEDLSPGLATSSEIILGGFVLELEKATSSVSLLRTSQVSQTSDLLARLPLSDYVFFAGPEDLPLLGKGWLTLYDTKNHIMHLLDYDNARGSVERRVLLAPATSWAWSKDASRLVYYNDFEIWILDLEAGSQELITRLAAGITAVVWHERENYLLYITDNKLRVTELGSSAEPHSLDLLELPQLKNLVYSDQEGIVYVEGVAGNQQGWFEVEIQ